MLKRSVLNWNGRKNVNVEIKIGKRKRNHWNCKNRLEELKQETIANFQPNLDQSQNFNQNTNQSIYRAKPPKLPYFNERDDLDAYLERLERYAKVQNWPIGDWAINLASLLTGKALNVYSSLHIDDANKYNTLKLALCKWFNLTPSGYRYKFRTTKPDRNESASQYVNKLSNYLDG